MLAGIGLYRHHPATTHRMASVPQQANGSESPPDEASVSEAAKLWTPQRPQGSSPAGTSPGWELAVTTLHGPAAVALGASIGEEKALAEYLRVSGRPEPDKDAEWLNSKDWGILTPRQVAPFYVLGHEQYPPELENRDELIELTLQEVGKRLDWGMMKELPMEERLELVYHLMEEIPVQPTETITGWDSSEWDYGVMTYEALGRVGDLNKVVHREESQKVGFNVGTENWTGHFSPPEVRPSRKESTQDYTRYLRMVTHAEGRQSNRRVWGDDHHALSACNIVYNGLQRDPEKTQTFETLLQVTGSPWASYGYTEMVHALPEADHKDFENHVIGVYRELRQKSGAAAQEKISQVDEEKRLEPFIQWSYHVASLKRSDQTVDQALQEAEPQWQELRSSLPRMAHLEVYKQVGMMREPGQSAAESVQTFLDMNKRLRGQGRALDGLYKSMDIVPEAQKIRGPEETLGQTVNRLIEGRELLSQAGITGKPAGELLQGLLSGTTGPLEGFTETLETAAPIAAEAQLPPKVMGQLLKMAMQESEQPLKDRVEGLVDQYRLTGDLEGMEKIRERIVADVAAGKLEGRVDDLFEEFEQQARLQSLLVDDPERIVKLAYDALAPERAEDLEIDIEEGIDCITIGSITLDRM